MSSRDEWPRSHLAASPMNLSCLRSMYSAGSMSGRPYTRDFIPMSAYSCEKVIPDLAVRSDSVTSCATAGKTRGRRERIGRWRRRDYDATGGAQPAAARGAARFRSRYRSAAAHLERIPKARDNPHARHDDASAARRAHPSRTSARARRGDWAVSGREGAMGHRQPVRQLRVQQRRAAQQQSARAQRHGRCAQTREISRSVTEAKSPDAPAGRSYFLTM